VVEVEGGVDEAATGGAAAMRMALLELAHVVATATFDGSTWQHALTLTVAGVPGAQGGAVLSTRDGGDLVAEARVGIEAATGPEVRTRLSWPLVVAGRVQGVLELTNSEREDAFDDVAVAVAEAIAALLASALHRRTLERDLQAERERYAQMVSHDALTELPNRRLFRDRLHQALARARRRDRRVGVLFIDLDGFKDFNDRHGHGAGDELLKAIGARLAATVRGEDTVARIGGDEFGVLLADVHDAEDAAAVGGKLLVALSAPVALEDAEVRLGASVGVAVFPDHGIDPDAVMRAADDAVTRVKDDGKDGVRIADDDVGADPRQERLT
jgi:diguanylate cyclase (GGDEF)-like protein